MSDFSRMREPNKPPGSQPPLPRPPEPESGRTLAILIGCVVVLFLIGIRLAYDGAEEHAPVAANPPAIQTPAQTTASAPSKPAETTGSGGAQRDNGAKDQNGDVNANGDKGNGDATPAK